MLKKLSIILIAAMIINACASPKVVERKKYTDAQLSCSEIKYEMDECEKFRQDAMKEKGATGTNVAAAIFFWPAIFATYNNVNDAVQAADDRKNHLFQIYKEKHCDKAK